jgi:hypothetical protein
MTDTAGPTGATPPGGERPTTAPLGAGLDLDDLAADLPARAADAVEQLVDTIFDRVVRPLLVAARAVVFGLLIAAVALVIAVLVSVALVRFLDVYVVHGKVWISYLIIGGLFTALGAFAWSQRSSGSAAT